MLSALTKLYTQWKGFEVHMNASQGITTSPTKAPQHTSKSGSCACSRNSTGAGLGMRNPCNQQIPVSVTPFMARHACNVRRILYFSKSNMIMYIHCLLWPTSPCFYGHATPENMLVVGGRRTCLASSTHGPA
jgi:hypothetical protein